MSNFAMLPYGTYIGFILILCGLFFKLGIAPFHVWLPDIYGGSPVIITFFISIIPKIPVIYVFFNLFRPWNEVINCFEFYNIFYPLVIFCAMLSIFIGAVGGLYELTILRFVAFSSIANFGYVLLGLGLSTLESFAASVYYFFIVYLWFYFLLYFHLYETSKH